MKDLKEIICTVAKDAGKLLVDKFDNVKSIGEKKGAGIVTEADLMSEELITKALTKEMPETSILSEEMGEKNIGRDDKWIIDPLDGTSNYAHGFPWYCVSIALEQKGLVTAGGIYHPVLDEMFYAEKGKGAFLNNKRIRVSHVTNIKRSLLATGFFYHTGDELAESVKRFEKVQQVALGVRRPGSAALDMAYTACGRFDSFWERGLCPWDKAAGEIIFKEAGGTLTNFTGGKFSIYSDETLATNGHLHNAMIELLKI